MHRAFRNCPTCSLLAALLSVVYSGDVEGQGIDKDLPANISPASSGSPSATTKEKGYLGLSVDYVPEAVRAQTTLEEGFGLSVVFVVPGGPGDNAGVRHYDVLSKFDDQRLTNPESLRSLASERTPGDEVVLTVLRRDRVEQLQVTVGDFRDAPVGLVPGVGEGHNAPLVESLLKLFSRGGAGGGIDLKATPNGDFRLEWKEPMEGLLSDLRERAGKDGIRLETLDVRQSTVISTPEMDIFITSDSKDDAPWVLARGKNGEQLFAGQLSEDSPLEVRRIIDDTREMHQFPALPATESH